MAIGKTKCPICRGTGIVKEDSAEYEFVTRDPTDSRCLICDGSGYVGARKKLPDGREVHTIMSKRGLRVDRKSKVADSQIPDIGIDLTVPGPGKEFRPSRYIEMATNPRLNKVLASGKDFLIVTDTEPYFLDVFRMIRAQERRQGSWTLEDEGRYVEALEARIEELSIKEAYNG